MSDHPKCPKCGEPAAYQPPDGTFWDSSAHFWREASEKDAAAISIRNAEPVHCDELIDDPAQPECLRRFLGYRCQPAIEQTLHEHEEPELYARLIEDREGSIYLGYWNGSEPAVKSVLMKAGQVVRVVMASRFGDLGITPDLKTSRGYVTRLHASDLTDFSALPPQEAS